MLDQWLLAWLFVLTFLVWLFKGWPAFICWLEKKDRLFVEALKAQQQLFTQQMDNISKTFVEQMKISNDWHLKHSSELEQIKDRVDNIQTHLSIK